MLSEPLYFQAYLFWIQSPTHSDLKGHVANLVLTTMLVCDNWVTIFEIDWLKYKIASLVCIDHDVTYVKTQCKKLMFSRRWRLENVCMLHVVLQVSQALFFMFCYTVLLEKQCAYNIIKWFWLMNMVALLNWILNILLKAKVETGTIWGLSASIFHLLIYDDRGWSCLEFKFKLAITI